MTPPASLTVKGLRKRYGRHEVLNGVDLELPRNSIYGFVGLNGSGKTTTLECALGLLRADGGEIAVLGRRPRELHRLGGRVAAVFDSPCLHPYLTVRQALEHARVIARKGSRSAAEVEGLLGIEAYRSVRVGKLSFGNQRRVAIAHALVGRPELLVLDEPFAGLDAGGVDDLLELVQRLHRDEGATFLLSSHQLHHVERICTHVSILHRGEVALHGTIAALLDARGSRLRLRVDDPERALALLSADEGLRAFRRPDGGLEVELVGGTDAAEINRRLVQANVAVSELIVARPELASVFRRVVGSERE